MKRLLRLVLCALLLSVTFIYTSYSWILDTEVVVDQKVLNWNYNGIYDDNQLNVITFEGISAEFYLYDEDGNWDEDSPLDPDEFMEHLDMKPGDSLRFKIRIYNESDDQTVKLYAVGVSSLGEGENKNAILNNIYFSCWPGEGYVDNDDIIADENLKPKYIFQSLATLMVNSDRVATIYTDLYIPATEGTGLDLECKIWFDTEGSIQSSGISIDNFSFTK